MTRMPPQLEKNHVVPTAWQDEALARDGVSREVPCSTLMLKLMSIKSVMPSNHLILCRLLLFLSSTDQAVDRF